MVYAKVLALCKKRAVQTALYSELRHFGDSRWCKVSIPTIPVSLQEPRAFLQLPTVRKQMTYSLNLLEGSYTNV